MASFWDHNAGLLIIGFALGIFVSSVHRRKHDTVIPSPLEAVSRFSANEVARLPYPPDALPGARDIASPYGTLRVYEWGPKNGRKVLMVHGISTPCIALGASHCHSGTTQLADSK